MHGDWLILPRACNTVNRMMSSEREIGNTPVILIGCGVMGIVIDIYGAIPPRNASKYATDCLMRGIARTN